MSRIGRESYTIAGDIGDPAFANWAVSEPADTFGGLDIVVNKRCRATPQDEFLDVTFCAAAL